MVSKARNLADLATDDVLETTSTGVEVNGTLTASGANVTGTVTADGLTVDGSGTAIDLRSNNNAGTALNVLRFTDTDASAGTGQDIGKIEFYSSDIHSNTVAASIRAKASDPSPSGDLVFSTTNDSLQLLKRLEIDEGGDISFFEDTGTTAKFFWDASAERLGIGTLTPDTLLDINGEATVKGKLTINYEGSDGYSIIQGPLNRSLYVDIASNNDFDAFAVRDGRDDSQRFVVQSGGNVGIGTSSPSAKLEVSGGLLAPAEVRINNAGGSWTAGDEIGRFSFYTTDGSGIGARELASIRGVTEENSTTSGGALAFYGSATNGNSTERMRIDSSGNVGIGTQSPDGILHVYKSDVTAYNDAATDGQVGVGPTIYLENPANANTTVGGQIVFGMRSTEEQARIGATGGSSPALVFGTDDAERMRIDSDGNVGIGTDSPDTKLHVFANSAGDLLTLESGDVATVPNIVWKNADGQKAELAATDNSDLVFKTGSANEARMVIAGNGYVGIGNNSPDKPFEVSDNRTSYSDFINNDGDLLIRTTNSPDMLQLIDAGAANETEAAIYQEYHYSNGIGAGSTRIGYMGFSSVNNNTFTLRSDTTDGNIDFKCQGDIILYPGLTNEFMVKDGGDLKFNSGYGSAAIAYGCRAWCSWNAATNAIRGSGNVSSITNIGTGTDYVNFTTSMPDTNYAVVASVDESLNSGDTSALSVRDLATNRFWAEIEDVDAGGVNNGGMIAVFR